MITKSMSSTDGKDIGNDSSVRSTADSAIGSGYSLSRKLGNGSTITIYAMVVENIGKVGTQEQTWWASSGDVKFNIEISDWPWNDEGLDIDLVNSIKSNEEWIKKENDTHVYTIGDDSQLNLAIKYYALNESGIWQSKGLSAGYPTLHKGDNESVFTFRFGKFGIKIFYDPLIKLLCKE
jgi:hypothetical protein